MIVVAMYVSIVALSIVGLFGYAAWAAPAARSLAKYIIAIVLISLGIVWVRAIGAEVAGGVGITYGELIYIDVVLAIALANAYIRLRMRKNPETRSLGVTSLVVLGLFTTFIFMNMAHTVPGQPG